MSIQFIKVHDGIPVGSPQSFPNHVPPSPEEWKLFVPWQEEYDATRAIILNRYIESDDIVAQIVAPYPDDVIAQIEIEELRQARNTKLQECDWTRLDDNGLSDGQREEWSVYRQALRDITQNYSDLESVVWPPKP